MTTVLWVLISNVALLYVTEIILLYLLMRKNKVMEMAEERTVEEPNEFEAEKYVDLTEVTPEMGIKSLTRK